MDRADKMNEIINEILTMKDSLSSDQPEIMNQLQQLLNEANDIRERLHVSHNLDYSDFQF